MHPAYVKKLLQADNCAEWYLPFTCSVGIFQTFVPKEKAAKGLDRVGSPNMEDMV